MTNRRCSTVRAPRERTQGAAPRTFAPFSLEGGTRVQVLLDAIAYEEMVS